MAAALLCVASPRRLQHNVLLAALQLGWFVAWYDAVSMVHWYIAATFHLGLLLCCMEALMRARCRRAGLERVVRTGAARHGKWILIAGFFFAGFAKLNSDFLDPELSCGAVYYHWLGQIPLLGWLLPMGSWAGLGASVLAATFEVMGPLLLLSRRTWKFGLLACWVLQFSLGINPRSHYFEFAGLFFSAGIFVLPGPTIDALDSLRKALLARMGRLMRRPARGSSVALALTLATLLLLGMSGYRRDALELLRALWVVPALALLGALLLTKQQIPPPRRPRQLLAPLVVLIPFVLNEASPYFGLPHQPAIIMAANLRLTPGNSNHLLFQEIPTFGPTQNVTVLRSTSKRFRKGQMYPWPAFVERMSHLKRGSVDYRLGEGEAQNAKAGDAAFAGGSMLARVLKIGAHRGQETFCAKPLPGMTAREWRRHARTILRARRREKRDTK